MLFQALLFYLFCSEVTVTNELCCKRLKSRHQTRQRLRRILRFAYARTVLLTRNKPAYADLTLDIFSTRPQPQLTRSNFYLQEPQRF